jgi:hypothetical protein
MLESGLFNISASAELYSQIDQLNNPQRPHADERALSNGLLYGEFDPKQAIQQELDSLAGKWAVRKVLRHPVYEAVIPWGGHDEPRLHVAVGNFAPISEADHADPGEYNRSRFYQAVLGGFGDDDELRMRLRSTQWAHKVHRASQPRRLNENSSLIVWDVTTNETHIDPYSRKRVYRRVPITTRLNLFGFENRRS